MGGCVINPSETQKFTGQKRPPRTRLQASFERHFWVCRTGAQWNELPDKYPPYQTCHRYFQNWVKAGVW
ncbi:MAG: transposase [Flammeovirgaceae bacterium]